MGKKFESTDDFDINELFLPYYGKQYNKTEIDEAEVHGNG